ncbi:MAG TPA: polyphosphate kinase 2 family protein [Gemmatimonadaceae bacterium]|nr:polyphosphate kinase 2 family protein [Gemmatimonadaceae bacterium]
MILEPVSSRSKLELSDDDALPPSDLPKGDELEKKIEKVTERLGELQSIFFADAHHALLIVLQGRDASGKDGVVRTVFDACNPQGVRVNSFKVPSPIELAHDYLWRIHQVVPERGMIGVFNRSHYEDVLVVRVHDIVPKEVWSKRYDQINQFERILSENGVVILKFYLHVSREEQRKRLLERIEDPTKNWKFSAGDLDERKLWDKYTVAYRDALKKCSTEWAPWYVVPADKNKARNYLIAKRILKTLEDLNLEYPKPKADLQQYIGELKDE